LIRRCAWHKHYFGHDKIIAIIKDGNPITTDGICQDCRQMVSKEIERMKKEKDNDRHK